MNATEIEPTRRTSRPASRPAVDPRVTRTKASVIEAATDLLVDLGPNAVTIDAIVARSGVAKSTIYRHWATRDAILIDVLRTLVPQLPQPDPGADFETRLRQVADHFVIALNDERWQRVLPAMLLLRLHEPDVASFDNDISDEQHKLFLSVFELGRREGRLRDDVIDEQIVATLVGPLLFAQLTGKVPLDDALAAHVVNVVLTVYAPPS